VTSFFAKAKLEMVWIKEIYEYLKHSDGNARLDPKTASLPWFFGAF
jgi:hypothetical protein